ncbi:MAG TPA: methionyl-tRNA formyltransferase [Bacteroidia bacterium]|nr:methionyl-tRNA formyltransferase [Bacteroidia bacterium]
MLRYGVLASGELGRICLEGLIKSQHINFIFTDSKSAGIEELATANNIPCLTGKPNGKAKEFLAAFTTDVILSVNYLFIVDGDILSHPAKYAINFHGSLLPKYRGRTPHVWAIINNEKETGVTAHLMTKGCDEGDIILQQKIEITSSDTGAELLAKFNSTYPELINKVIFQIENNAVTPVPQDNSKATFFGKRTPEDGLIDWNWQRERIYNWVRAQAKPYPGAFTNYKGNKITIHKISFSDAGFDYTDPNGKILSTRPLTVKTPNGAVILEEIENEIPVTKGDILNV